MFGDLLGAEVESYNVVRHLRAGRGSRERGGGGEGIRPLPSVFMKNISASLEGVPRPRSHAPPNLPLLIQFQITCIFFTTKRHSSEE